MPSDHNKRLAEIEKRVNNATPGPWQRWTNHFELYQGPFKENTRSCLSGAKATICSADPDFFCDGMSQAQIKRNLAFIAHAREDVPYLLERVRELELKISEDA